MEMTSRQLLDSVHRVLEEVDRRLASGKLDRSGRFYTDEELSAGAATGKVRKRDDSAEEPAG